MSHILSAKITITHLLIALSLVALAASHISSKAPNATRNRKPTTAKIRAPKSIELSSKETTSDSSFALNTPNSNPNETSQDSNVRLYYEPSSGNSDDEPYEQDPEFAMNIDFNLMNSSKDRIQAVRNLVANQPHPNNPMQPTNDDPNSGQCSHKGRMFSSGQIVPIEDQPCLSCTCRRSILQCFLRVCPPVISIEAQKRLVHSEQSSGITNSTSNCRIVKEPNQCCPSLKCTDPNPNPPPDERLTKSLGLATSESLQSSVRSANSTRLSSNQNSDFAGPEERNRDSLLLINSNPVHEPQEAPSDDKNSTSTRSAMNRYEHSNVLLDALIEAAYSSAAQMSGFNMQGSCLINGSLYVEGSAVLTGTNSYCQYCYCIRQKIMCVRPKCQLYISGCRPRYGSEFACCPLSYDCSNGNGNQTSLTRPISQGSASELMDKLSAALESISRLSNLDKSQTDLSARHAGDRALNTNMTVNNLPQAVFDAIMNSAVENQTNSSDFPTPTFKSTSTSTSTTTTTTTTSTTTTRPSKVISTTETPETDGTPKPNKEDDDGDIEGNKASGSTSSSSDKSTSDNSTSSTDGFMEPMNKLGPMPTISGSSGCNENGHQYEIGEQIPTLDRCKHCYCGLEGIKECKIVECTLKIAHNCKPVIPKDHCCPIRYDCPTSATNNLSDPHFRANEMSSRFRSENPAGRNIDTSDDFSTVSMSSSGKQCKSDQDGNCTPNGVENSNPNATRPENLSIFAGQLNGALEDIKGLSGFGPFSETVRSSSDDINANKTLSAETLNDMIESFTQSNNISASNTGDNIQPNVLHLNEELNKFIMQINQNSNATSMMDNQMGSNYSLVSGPLEHSHQLQMPNSQMALPPDTSNHNQRLRMADYNSVQANPDMANIQLAPIENAGIGIPSIEPEQIGNLFKGDGQHLAMANVAMMGQPNGRLQESKVEYSDNGDRAFRGDQRKRQILNDWNAANQSANPFKVSDQPEIVNMSDDYFDSANESNKFGGPNSNRTTGARSVIFRSNPVYGSDIEQTPPTNVFSNFSDVTSLNPVHFDDELTTIRLDTNPLHGASSKLDDQSAGFRDDSSTTPLPPQPTTGTPIGLDTDRSNETRGWLRSLSGFVNQFGRRISSSSSSPASASITNLGSVTGSTVRSELQSEASDGASPTRNTEQNGSIFNQIFRNVIGLGDSQVTARSTQPSGSSGLVMRPLQSLMSVIRDSLRPDNQSTSDTSLAMSEASKVEIITAPTPFDTGALTEIDPVSLQKVGSNGITTNENSFARRSDVMETFEPDNRMLPKSLPTYKVNQLKISNLDTSPTPKSQPKNQLVCIDTVKNQVYQANEIIPKDDACKTCTCVLGKELCQTLVCPERPAENCRQEKPRPGECCPNYLCGDGVGNNLTIPLATTGSTTGKEDFSSTQQSFNQVFAQQMAPISSVARHAEPNRPSMNPNQMQNFRAPSVIANNNHKLPPHPIRTSDLLSSLPSHLRFKPSVQQAPMSLPNLAPGNPQFFNGRDQLLAQLMHGYADQKQVISDLNGLGQNQSKLVPRQLGQPQTSFNHLNQRPANPNSNNFNNMIQFPTLNHPQKMLSNINRPLRSNANADPLAGRNPMPALLGDKSKLSSILDGQNRINFPQNIDSRSHTQDPISGSSQITWLPVDKPSVNPFQASASNHIEAPSNGQKISESVGNQTKPDRVLFKLNDKIDMSTDKTTVEPKESKFQSVDHTSTTTEPTSTVSTMVQSTSETVSPDTSATILNSRRKLSNDVDMPPTVLNESTSILASSTNRPGNSTSETSESTTIQVQRQENQLISESKVQLDSKTNDDSLHKSNPISQTDNHTDRPTSEMPILDDPFRVSECNVFGKLYKLGEDILMLGDACKKCTCTNMGVDCEVKC